ncbi:uncharacterized protein K452DRAFT_299055 [Aplosporella prunicola CBS 121167]|uniref:Uncharacterized protein n=1 Tax=Aplosporella prunicola CBS 121167 TaxID=1176127 RepID=A0A6A6BA93_9PEZI|nr:uncharacterized protein K452DRAFT_299055 [Aplosporella prunicola CBS 121167]KAF2140990.1 hypothetical protein K452DRAFT_299055 [Aplosporella prunicola CBS 121167]
MRPGLIGDMDEDEILNEAMIRIFGSDWVDVQLEQREDESDSDKIRRFWSIVDERRPPPPLPGLHNMDTFVNGFNRPTDLGSKEILMARHEFNAWYAIRERFETYRQAVGGLPGLPPTEQMDNIGIYLEMMNARYNRLGIQYRAEFHVLDGVKVIFRR